MERINCCWLSVSSVASLYPDGDWEEGDGPA